MPPLRVPLTTMAQHCSYRPRVCNTPLVYQTLTVPSKHMTVQSNIKSVGEAVWQLWLYPPRKSWYRHPDFTPVVCFVCFGERLGAALPSVGKYSFESQSGAMGSKHWTCSAVMVILDWCNEQESRVWPITLPKINLNAGSFPIVENLKCSSYMLHCWRKK